MSERRPFAGGWRQEMVDDEEEGRVSLWAGFVRHARNVDSLRDLCGVDHCDLEDQEVIVDDHKKAIAPDPVFLGSFTWVDDEA